MTEKEKNSVPKKWLLTVVGFVFGALAELPISYYLKPGGLLMKAKPSC